MPSAICDCTLNLLESHLNSLPKTWRVRWMGFISSLQRGSLKQCCRALVMHINPFFEGYNSSCECQVSFSIWLSQKLSLSPMTITSVSILLCVSDATSLCSSGKPIARSWFKIPPDRHTSEEVLKQTSDFKVWFTKTYWNILICITYSKVMRFELSKLLQERPKCNTFNYM